MDNSNATPHGTFSLPNLLSHHLSKSQSLYIRDSRQLSDDLYKLVFGDTSDHEESLFNLFAHVTKILLLEVPSSMLENVLANPAGYTYYNCFTLSQPSIESLAAKVRKLVKAEEQSEVLAAGLDVYQEAGKFAYVYGISIDDLFDWK